ncbi:substrate-binding periplasmic protein [Roseomonas populi]|uniref:ABC transporter substrate-binding protein n=1 Tax=Roseomonas populi TaxID=3121582 RepID=A0ABT1XAR0_9PROT|nr:ABC transporter substrate-binding protein [Roseomonas pecuniae]MCR0984789.1 ABC transporter substrate-binding protein [Roseomonas pecuniae]
MVGTALAQSSIRRNGEPAAPARPGEKPADRLSLIRARRELLICTVPDLPALSWRNARNGELEGLDADMARYFAAQLRVRPVFVETLPGVIVGLVERGGCDVGMGGLGISPARAEQVAFTKPFLSGPLAAVSQRSNQRVPGWGEMDREGVVVSVLAGSVAEEVMRQRLRQAELFAVPPPLNPEQETSAGRADVFVTDYADSRRLREDDAWRVSDAPRTVGETLYAYAVPKGDPAWLAEVNRFLSAVKGDGTLLRAAQRWGLREMLVN